MQEIVSGFTKATRLELIHLGVARSVLIQIWPYLAIIVAHFIWGTNFVVAKLTLNEIPPMSLAFLRFVLATILLSPFLLTEKNGVKIARRDLPKLVSIGIFMVTLNISLFYSGLTRTTVISASVLTMVIPVFSVLLSWWFLKEKIYTMNLIGILVGILGTILVIGVPLILIGASTPAPSLLGNFLIILASLSWVIGAIISKKMLQKYSTLTVTGIIFLVGVITFLIPALNEYIQNPQWIFKVTYLGLSGLLFIAILSSISAYFLFEWGLNKLGVVKADLFQYIEPVIATSFGILILGEQLRLSFIAGAILVGMGVYWGTLAKQHHKHHKAHRV